MRSMMWGLSGWLVIGGLVLAGYTVGATEETAVVQAPAVTNHVPVQPATSVTQDVKQAISTDTNTAATVAAPSVTPPPAEELKMSEVEAGAWKSASWQVGTRYLQVKLQDKTRGTPGNGSYFGTITAITEKQDGVPDKAYIQYRLSDWPLWVGVSYDHVVARTMDDGNGDGIPDASGGDGDEEIQGAIPYLQAAWDNPTRLTPYVQAGYAFYQAKFKPNSWGDNGMRWVSAKSNVRGLELGGGLNIRLYKNISADLFAKYMKVDDITGDWYYAYGLHGGPFVMTMSYVAYGGGLSWRF